MEGEGARTELEGQGASKDNRGGQQGRKTLKRAWQHSSQEKNLFQEDGRGVPVVAQW